MSGSLEGTGGPGGPEPAPWAAYPPPEPEPGAAGTPRGGWVLPAVVLGLVVAVGLVWGLLWWWVAPTATTQVVDGAVYLSGHDDLFASQDSWFGIFGAGAGALMSVVWPALTRRTPVAGLVAGLVGSAAAGLLAWQLGGWLGPDALRTQLHAGVKAPITPLALHAPIAVLVAPMIFAAVRVVMEIAAHFLDGRRTPEAQSWPPPPPPARPPYSAPQGVHIEQGQ